MTENAEAQGNEANLDAIFRALAAMEVSEARIAKLKSDPVNLKLKDIGLDSKDLLMLDFHLEETDGLNVEFHDLDDEMTVAEFSHRLVKQA